MALLSFPVPTSVRMVMKLSSCCMRKDIKAHKNEACQDDSMSVPTAESLKSAELIVSWDIGVRVCEE